jgi:uncharacterized membrane protein YjfL (UPF0719 family)
MENLFQNEYILLISESLAYVFTAFVVFYIGKLAYGIFNPKIDVKNELVEKDNLAFSIAHVGYFIGLILAIGSAIIGETNGIWIDVADIFIYGILAIILLNLSIIINDKILLRKFSVHKEIVEDQNEGTGVIEAASAIASGLIIFGAVTGDAEGTLLHQILSAVVFWLIGQFVLILTLKVYNTITPYSVLEHVEKDNVPVGIAFSGTLVAIGVLVKTAIGGDFISWTESLSNLGYYVIVGYLLLPIVRYLTDKILLPGRSITDELINQEKPNVGAGLIEAFAYIGGAVLISWCL